VFLDYNQNAKDRTTCSAYSVRPLPDARVSAPLHWREVADCEPADFTVLTMPARFAEIGDPYAGIDATPGSLEGLLELAAKDEAEGLGDAPWPLSLYLARGGQAENTVGRKCICNAVVANIGHPQIRNGQRVENGLVTAGDDLNSVPQFLAPGRSNYSAEDVIAALLSG
jgi:hypothetical protein